MANSQSKPKKISIQYSPGIYRVTFDISPESFMTIIANQELELFYLHGVHIHDKQSFIASLAETAKFPDYAQTNWDSLEECLRDLSWCPAAGYVIFYQGIEPFQTTAPDDWATALEILATAVDFWKDTNTPMYVFLE